MDWAISYLGTRPLGGKYWCDQSSSRPIGPACTRWSVRLFLYSFCVLLCLENSSRTSTEESVPESVGEHASDATGASGLSDVPCDVPLSRKRRARRSTQQRARQRKKLATPKKKRVRARRTSKGERRMSSSDFYSHQRGCSP